MDGVLFQAGICQGVDPDSARVLEDLLKPVEFRREQVIFAEGQAGDLLYVLTEGKVRVWHTGPDGRENTLTVAGPPDMVGSLATPGRAWRRPPRSPTSPGGWRRRC